MMIVIVIAAETTPFTADVIFSTFTRNKSCFFVELRFFFSTTGDIRLQEGTDESP